MKKLLKITSQIWLFICSLIASRACIYYIFGLHEKDPRIPKWYGKHVLDYEGIPITGNVHAVAGILLITSFLLQIFSSRSNKFKEFHIINGHFATFISIVLVISGVIIGYKIPFGGLLETYTSIFFAVIYLIFIFHSFISGKKGELNKHREFVTRSIFLALSIGTLRIGITIFKNTKLFK